MNEVTLTGAFSDQAIPLIITFNKKMKIVPTLAALVWARASNQEGFSIAILEALSVPITDKCHLPEVKEWQAGAVVPDTVEGVKAGLEWLLSLPQATPALMGENARAAVERHYSWPVIAAQLEALYANGPSRI